MTHVITSMKVLLIGQAPGRKGDAYRPLEGRVASKLAGLAGVSVEDWLDRTERMNLLDEFPGKAGKGDIWNTELTRKKAEEVKPYLVDRTVLLLGRNVARAFGLVKLSWMVWTEEFGARMAVIPHPSGIVIWWNSLENREKVGIFLKGVLEG